MIRVWDGKLHKSETVFFTSYIIYLTLMMLRTTMFSVVIGETAYKLVALGCLCLLLVKEYIDRYQPMPVVIYLLFLILFFILIKKNASFLTSAPLFFIYSGRNIEFRKIAKVTICVELIVLVVVILSSLIGVIENYQYETMTERPREFIGFLYALYPQAYVANIAGLWFYVKREKVSLISLIVLELLNYWIYTKTDSRLCFLMATILLLSALLYKIGFRIKKNRYKSAIKTVVAVGFIFLYIICYIGSLWVHINYNPGIAWMSRINKILVNRLYHGHKSYVQYGISALGQFIQWVGHGLRATGEVSTGDYLYVDNLYLQSSQKYGLLLTILVLIAVTVTLYHCYTQKDYVLLFLFGTVAVHAVIDDLVLHLWYNTFLFVVGQVVFTNVWLLRKKRSVCCQKGYIG